MPECSLEQFAKIHYGTGTIQCYFNSNGTVQKITRDKKKHG